jgi:hypothetical protein
LWKYLKFHDSNKNKTLSASISYLRKPFEGEAGMVPLLRGEQSLKTLSKLSLAWGKALSVFLSNLY